MAEKLVVLENSKLAVMATQKAVVAEFPFLRELTKQPSSCCGKAKQRKDQVYSRVKAAIAAMGDEQKRRLKKLLGAKQARIFYTTSSGKAIKHTF